MARLRAREMAVRIVEHLRRLETKKGNESLYYEPAAYVKAGWIVITYNKKEGKNYPLSLGDAYQYLNWLDAGNEGPHWVSQEHWPEAENWE